MAFERIGQCRYCGYEPIASTARVCPRCGGTSPFEPEFPWMTVIILVLALLAAGGTYLYFFSGLI